MKTEFTPYLFELTFDALLKSYHRKKSLKRFLQSMGIKENVLATFNAETKREFLEDIFPKLQQTEVGKKSIVKMAQALSEYSNFPNLTTWDDAELKISEAKDAVTKLKAYMLQQDKTNNDNDTAKRIVIENQKKAENIRKARTTINNLEKELEILITQLGTSKAGYAFQDWFYKLADFFEASCRRPYHAHGRQIDGSLSINGTDYLVELKFQSGQADVVDIDSALSKLKDKADNTMGIVISISGYSSIAIHDASYGRTQLLLLDYNHIQLLLREILSLPELIERLKIHAAQTGEAYLDSQTMLR